MGHTNSTANLSLPQFIGTDKPTWLGDINGAFSALDAYAGTNDAAVSAAASDASSAISQAATAVNTANTANTTAGNASTAANNAIGVANNAVAIAGVVDGKVGLLADLNTTDRTSIVNAINEVATAAGTTYDNTGSGLTATNVQDAIDEVAQGGGGGTGLTDVFDVTSDGTKTVATALGEIETYITGHALNNSAFIMVDAGTSKRIYRLADAVNHFFICQLMTASNARIFELDAKNAAAYDANITTGSTTISDTSSATINNSTVYRFFN